MSASIKRKFEDRNDGSNVPPTRDQSTPVAPPHIKRPRLQVDVSAEEGFSSETHEPLIQNGAIRKQPKQQSTLAQRKHSSNELEKYKPLYNNLVQEARRPSDSFNFDLSNLKTSQIGGTIWSIGDKERFFGALARYGKNMSKIAVAVRKSVLEVSLLIHHLEAGVHKQQVLGFDADRRELAAAVDVASRHEGRLEQAADALAWSQFRYEIMDENVKHGEQWLLREDDIVDEAIDEQTEDENEEASNSRDDGDGKTSKENRKRDGMNDSESDEPSVVGDLDEEILRRTEQQDEHLSGPTVQKHLPEEMAATDLSLSEPPTLPVVDSGPRTIGPRDDMLVGGDTQNQQIEAEQSTDGILIDPDLPDFSFYARQDMRENSMEGLANQDLLDKEIETNAKASATKENRTSFEAVAEAVESGDERTSYAGSEGSNDTSEQPNGDSDLEFNDISDTEAEQLLDLRDRPGCELPLLDHSAMLTLSKNVFMNSSREDISWPTYLDYFYIAKEQLPRPLTGPAIFRTAYEDLTRVTTMLTKRLVAVAQYQAQSRMRMMDNIHEDAGKFVTIQAKDVQAAADILGLKRDSFEYWADLPRRHDVNWEFRVFQDRDVREAARVRITAKAAEACLRHRGPSTRFLRIIERVQGSLHYDFGSEVESDGENALEHVKHEEDDEPLDLLQPIDSPEATDEDDDLEKLDEENNARGDEEIEEVISKMTKYSDYWKEQAQAKGAWPLRDGLYSK